MYSLDQKRERKQKLMNNEGEEDKKDLPSPRIPHVIFQTYSTKDVTKMPFGFPWWHASWLKHHPTWEHILWDDAENRVFIEQYYPWFLPRYDSYPAEIFRADAVRPFRLFHFGGVYADMDFEALKPLDDLVDQHDGHVLLGTLKQYGSEADMNGKWSQHHIPNAIMASSKHHPFWLTVFSMLLQAPVDAPPEATTGPVLLRAAMNAYINQRECVTAIVEEDHKKRGRFVDMGHITLMDPHIFYPVDWTTDEGQEMRKRVITGKELLTDEETRKLFPNSYAVTYWAHSWGDQVV